MAETIALPMLYFSDYFLFLLIVLVISLRRLDQSTVTSVTSGVQPAAILAGSVTTNTSPSTEGLTVPPQWCPSLAHDGGTS